MRRFNFVDLRHTFSFLPYEKFLEMQEGEWEKRLLNITYENTDTLIASYHLPTITLSARPIKEQLAHLKPLPGDWLEEADEELFLKARDLLITRHKINLVRTGRGGNLWYHDAGVLNFYIIANVNSGFPSEMVRPLEETLFQTVAALGLNPQRMPERWRHGFQSYIGVWVGGKKIAAVGIRLRRFGKRTISLYGAALNIKPDLGNFSLIDPCGIAGAAATSIDEECKNRKMVAPSEQRIMAVFLRKFKESFPAEFTEPVTANYMV